MIRLDAPYIPDEAYVDFLSGLGSRIESVHFSLYAHRLPDARFRFRSFDIRRLVSDLRRLEGPKKYALVNSRFHHLDSYFDEEHLERITGILALLVSENVLDGIIWADAFFLEALSRKDPVTASRLEAAPSVNLFVESMETLISLMDEIERAGFRPPGKIVLSPALNRDLKALSGLSALIRNRYPEIRISLLANEGCLYRCPYKTAHDALISAANLGLAADRTHEINREYGCVRSFIDSPWQVLKSPVIRPEDADRYSPFADVLKICGRTLGRAFLIRAATAYLDGFYDGNLLDLCDTMETVADRIHVDNRSIDPVFFETVTACDKDCTRCGFCRRIFKDAGRCEKAAIPPWEQILGKKSIQWQ